MVSILKILVGIVSFLQFTHAYCVYNRLTNSTSRPAFLKAMKSGKGEWFVGRFKATVVGYDSRACCPYTDTSCNPSGSLVEPVIFEIEPSFDGTVTDIKRLAKCDAGGALVMYGSNIDDLYGDCISRNGTTSRINLI